MARTAVRPGPLTGLVLVLVAAAVGCTGPDGSRCGPFARYRTQPGEGRPAEELKAAVGWVDPEAQSAGGDVLPREELVKFADLVKERNRPPVPLPKKNILVISGGGAYGAYPAGVLSGWTESGTRPQFDVVTGISTGALVAVYAFLGPSVDRELREDYTAVSDADIYKRRRFPQLLLSESLADNTPLARRIAWRASPERLEQIAAEHRKGRRLYVGTTDLDVRRGVFWDLGEIAARGTPESRDLFCKVLLASSAIPGFFPPVPIEVTVDGVPKVERHIDGGVSSSMFFAPPYVPPDQREALPLNWLYGSDLYVLVAGKVYPDPTPVQSRTLKIASNAISTIIYDQTRSDLHKLFLLSMVTGMNYHVSVMPKDLPAPIESTSFNPAEMTRMFEAGAYWARCERNWRNSPPGAEPGEGGRYRGGTELTDRGRRALIGPETPAIPIPGVPVKK